MSFHGETCFHWLFVPKERRFQRWTSQLWRKSDRLKFPVVCVMTGRSELLHLTDCWISQSPNHYWEVHTTRLNITDEFLSQWFFFPCMSAACLTLCAERKFALLFFVFAQSKICSVVRNKTSLPCSLYSLCAVINCCWNFLQWDSPGFPKKRKRLSRAEFSL